MPIFTLHILKMIHILKVHYRNEIEEIWCRTIKCFLWIVLIHFARRILGKMKYMAIKYELKIGKISSMY